MKQPTLAEIAAACGNLSTSTVSLALRNSPKIAQATREHVLSTARTMGYQPNRTLSRVMSEIRSGGKQHYKENIAYLVPHTQGYETAIYRGIHQRAKEIGYGIERFDLQSSENHLSGLANKLKARGIRGVIVAPFTQPKSQLPLDWTKFAGVCIGYTLSEPNLSRIARDLVHSVRQIFYHLEARGYRKIGFAMQEEHEARMDYANLSSYLLYEWQSPKNKRVPPLVTKNLDEQRFQTWYAKHRPDLIVTMHHAIPIWLKNMNIAVPDETGLFVLNTKAPDSKLSGIYPDYECMGASAVEQVTSLVERGEFGVPTSPKTILVNGIWIEGTTITQPPQE
ncbi:LacI family DNA-binding transcriptional regulator [Coraliomargarita parva]|uniref:LacI family DNA-binding transcriptional regulator n=1 Tax=Coraliomargarita parva TaxID=3014050 RepID=UPI0022B526EB|nr:LacI family DNA-binding transcriptional regulator [Coraliomargarita parva]